MSTTTATTSSRKKAVAAKPEVPKTNWHSISKIKVCPDCGEPRHTNTQGELFCPAGKGDCAFVKNA